MQSANSVGNSVQPPLVGGRYLLGAKVGSGGEGDTFRATDRITGVDCALKLFRGPVGDVLARVRSEFERLTSLDHPGVVRALDVGRHGEQLFLVTELVVGGSIASIAEVSTEAQRRIMFERAARELIEAVVYLHARGIVHGDISPENVRLAPDGRAVLIDLAGILRGDTGQAVGTLGFAAPEALVGRVSPATDLFALGATLFLAWTGSAPFGSGAEAVSRMWSARAPTLSATRPGLGEGWDRLLSGLLQIEPEQRPSSARAVLRELRRLIAPPDESAPVELLPPHPAGDPLAGIFVGRASERAELKTAFASLAEGASPGAAIAVVGAEGSGRRRLIDMALQDLAIAQMAERMPPVTVFKGSLSALLEWAGIASRANAPLSEYADDDPIRERQTRFAAAAVALEAHGENTPLIAALSAGAEEIAFASFIAGAPPSGRLLVVVAAPAPLARMAARDIALPPLDAEDVRTLVRQGSGEDPPQSACAAVVRAGTGHAATIVVLARQLVQAVRRGEGDRFQPTVDLALDDLLASSFATLSLAAQRCVAGVALGLSAGDVHPRSAQAQGGETEARAAGWLLLASSEGFLLGDRGDVAGLAALALPSVAHAAVVRRALAEPAFRDLAQAVVTVPGTRAEVDPVRGICWEALGDATRAIAAFRAAAAGAVAAGRRREAARWLEEAARLDATSLDVDERVTRATALALAGRGEAALSALEPPQVLGSTAPSLAAGDTLRLGERKAWLLARSGRLTDARLSLEATLAEVSADAPVGPLAVARARLARVLVSSGRFGEAVAAVTPLPTDPAAAALATESAVLAHAYGGDLSGARRLLAALEGGRHPSARELYLSALLDQMAGELRPALDAYQRALAEAESSGDIHTAAAIALNMGALAAEAGRYDQALVLQDRAIRELGRLSATAELATALFNAGTLSLELGDLPGTRAIVTRLRKETARRALLPDPSSVTSEIVSGSRAASPRSMPEHPPLAVTHLEAELALRAGDEVRALELFTRSSAAVGLDGPIRHAAMLARAELLARARRGAEAQAVLAELEGELSGETSPGMAEERRLARARVLLAGAALGVSGATKTDQVADLAAALEADGSRATRDGRRPRGWRTMLAAARLFHRAGQPTQAAATAAKAKTLFEEVRMSTPIDHHAGMEQDADARFLTELARLGSAADDSPSGARAERIARSEDRLRRLLRINKRLNSELRLPRLLELIMDAVIELTEAERGFILLEDDKGELVVKVARNIDQQTVETGAFDVSRSIARQAATGGVPIVTIDAAGDPRFREAVSVSDRHLRSVLAVPLQVKGRAVGTVYVDNRLRKGAFGEDDVQLVLDFAEQAGIAIENARLLAEVRRRERQIEVLNRRLQGELAMRKEELVGMKQELRENREALAIRYDYRNIIGRTPRMLDLFRLLDRLTDTLLPVVIQGESGTGKELVARALHFNGPRRDRPFVSENCAAIPETLLESTLFGAVRGAYTGADHDTRGLFEVADGGTLFLDEVGEMSPGMQGKLLRVLQTGELRRVGSEKMRRVDVRVIAATNRDLGRMVEEGKFRQDLFFRLAVASIALPPLRDRREDIPAIVDHVLGKLASKPAATPQGATGVAAAPTGGKRVTSAALVRLCAHRWPGNVRELENELMRAAALSDGDIGVDGLSPHIASDAEAALTTPDDPDSLTLRPRVERLERALMKEAMSRSGGNQTRAAVALGLSRFGLQKKLQRYRMG